MTKMKGSSRELAKRLREMSRQRCVGKVRLGVTTSEAVISALILGIVVSMLTSFAKTTRHGLRDRELSARVDWEIVNLREQIGSWETDRITEANIEAVPVSKPLSQRFEASKFSAQIVELESPLPAKQVTVQFECNYLGQQIQPAELTFWVTEAGPSSKAEASNTPMIENSASEADVDVDAESQDSASDEISSGDSDD